MAESSESVLIRATSGPAPAPAPALLATSAIAPSAATARSGKRPRPTTPRTLSVGADSSTTTATPTTTTALHGSIPDTERAARLRHPATRNAELNDLLQWSANPEVNFAMSCDAILLALSDLVLKECLDWQESMQEDDDYLVFRATGSWECPPTKQTLRFAQHCRRYSSSSSSSSLGASSGQTYPLLAAVAILMRNFSYTGANLRLLAYSPECFYMLTAFFYVGATDERYRRCVLRSDTSTNHPNVATSTNTNTSSSSNSSISNNNNFEIPLAALTTLLHMIAYIDVTGQQLVADRLFYKQDPIHGPPMPNQVMFGQTLAGSWTGLGACRMAKRLDVRDDVVEGLSTAHVLQFVTIQHLAAVYSLFPALAAILTDVHAARPVVVLALDVLQKWIDTARGGLVGQVPPEPPLDLQYGDPYDLPTLRALLVHIPDALLDRLTDLLYVPRLGNDSLEYVDPCFHMVTRVNTLRLLLNYDAVVDTDVRDRALDVLVPLLELDSPRMATRLTSISSNTSANNNNAVARIRLYDALIPAITTNTGRTEAAAVAAQLLRELAKAGAGEQSGLDYAQQRLVQIASRDPRVSQLVWKELYPVQEHISTQDEDDDVENDGDDDHDDNKHKGEHAASKIDAAEEVSTSQHDGVTGKGKGTKGS